MDYNPLQHLNVLVVEDQDVAQTMLVMVLKTIGIENIEVTANGVEGIAALEAAKQTFDVIICDIHMPEMDGYKFVRQIRLGAVDGYQEIPVLILTGDDSDANVQSAKVHRLDTFVTKPANAESMRHHILRALGLQEASG